MQLSPYSLTYFNINLISILQIESSSQEHLQLGSQVGRKKIKMINFLDKTVDANQCDQTTRLLLLYLAVYNHENYPNSIINLPNRFKNLPSTKQSLYQLPKPSKILPNSRNFAESGHTDANVALNVSLKCAQSGQKATCQQTNS